MGMIDRDWYKEHSKQKNQKPSQAIKTKYLGHFFELLSYFLIGASAVFIFSFLKNIF